MHCGRAAWFHIDKQLAAAIVSDNASVFLFMLGNDQSYGLDSISILFNNDFMKIAGWEFTYPVNKYFNAVQRCLGKIGYPF